LDFEKGVWTGLWLEGEMEKKLKEEVRVSSSGKLSMDQRSAAQMGISRDRWKGRKKVVVLA